MLSVARGGATVGAFCGQLHAELAKQLACVGCRVARCCLI